MTLRKHSYSPSHNSLSYFSPLTIRRGFGRAVTITIDQSCKIKTFRDGPSASASGSRGVGRCTGQEAEVISSLDGPISRQILSNDWALVRCYIMTAGEMLSCNKYGSVSRVGEEGALPFLQLWLVIPQSNTTCCVNVL